MSGPVDRSPDSRSEEHTSELQSHVNLVCRLLLEKKEALERFALEAAAGCFTDDLLYSHLPYSAGATGGLRHDVLCFFFNDTATTEIYTLSLHDALPICTKGTMRLKNKVALITGAGSGIGKA